MGQEEKELGVPASPSLGGASPLSPQAVSAKGAITNAVMPEWSGPIDGDFMDATPSDEWARIIWRTRVEVLHSHLRIIASMCEHSDTPSLQYIGKQARSGIETALRFVTDDCPFNDGKFAALAGATS